MVVGVKREGEGLSEKGGKECTMLPCEQKIKELADGGPRLWVWNRDGLGTQKRQKQGKHFRRSGIPVLKRGHLEKGVEESGQNYVSLTIKYLEKKKGRCEETARVGRRVVSRKQKGGVRGDGTQREQNEHTRRGCLKRRHAPDRRK